MLEILNWWLVAIVPLSAAGGALAHRHFAKPKYDTFKASTAPVAGHGSRERPPLRYGFTINGQYTGDIIPDGQNPDVAAIARSARERKTYGARRI